MNARCDRNAPFQLFRLRDKEIIKGYMKVISSKKRYYSTDKLWWTAKVIDYETKDAYSQYNDINQQWIFEEDIIQMTLLHSKKETIKAVILPDPNWGRLVAVNCKTLEFIDHLFFKDYRFKCLSYLFINEDLRQTLATNGWII